MGQSTQLTAGARLNKEAFMLIQEAANMEGKTVSQFIKDAIWHHSRELAEYYDNKIDNESKNKGTLYKYLIGALT